MYDLANCTVSILRGTTTNAYGDEVDTDPTTATIVAAGVPAQIRSRTVRPYDPASQTIRTIHTVEGRIGSATDVVESDRLRDDRTGVVYAIESINTNDGPGYVGDLELDLRRVV